MTSRSEAKILHPILLEISHHMSPIVICTVQISTRYLFVEPRVAHHIGVNTRSREMGHSIPTASARGGGNNIKWTRHQSDFVEGIVVMLS